MLILQSENYLLVLYEKPNIKSEIDADYFIEATNYNRRSTIYIFIRKRKENDNYVVVSFFKKASVFYQGGKAYWVTKEKITSDKSIILYSKSNSKTDNKDKEQKS